jgi:hypothetical protein
LDDQSKANADAFETYIDDKMDALAQTGAVASITFKTADFSKTIKNNGGGLTLKVKAHVTGKYAAAGWKVSEDDKGNMTIAASTRKKPGRHPGSHNKPKVDAPAPTGEPAILNVGGAMSSVPPVEETQAA